MTRYCEHRTVKRREPRLRHYPPAIQKLDSPALDARSLLPVLAAAGWCVPKRGFWRGSGLLEAADQSRELQELGPIFKSRGTFPANRRVGMSLENSNGATILDR